MVSLPSNTKHASLQARNVAKSILLGCKLMIPWQGRCFNGFVGVVKDTEETLTPEE